VLVRMLDTIRRIAPRMTREPVLLALQAEADAVREVGANEIKATVDKRDIETAWHRVEEAMQDLRKGARS